MDYVDLVGNTKLRDALALLGKTYKSIEIRSFAKKDGRRWQNAVSVIRFGKDTREEIDKILKETKNRLANLVGRDVGVFFGSMDFSDWPKLQESIESGKMKVGPRSLKLESAKEDLLSQLCSNSAATFRYPQVFHFPRISCQVSYDSKNPLQYLGYRFSGLVLDRKELLRSSMGLEDDNPYYGLVIELPIYANITGSAVKETKRVLFNMTIHPVLLRHISLAILQVTNPHQHYSSARHVKSVPTEKLKRKSKGGFLHCQAGYDIDHHDMVRSDMVEARLSMELGRISTGSVYLKEFLPLPSPPEGEKPSPLTVLSIFEGWSLIEQMLGLDLRDVPLARSMDDAFLLGATWILETIGLQTYQFELSKAKLVLGRIKSAEEGGERFASGDVDILAYDREEETYYSIDCTMTPPDPKKADLITNISEAIENRCGVHCKPMIMVCSCATNAKQSIQSCAILDHVDISSLLAQILEGRLEEARYRFRELVSPPYTPLGQY